MLTAPALLFVVAMACAAVGCKAEPADPQQAAASGPQGSAVDPAPAPGTSVTPPGTLPALERHRQRALTPPPATSSDNADPLHKRIASHQQRLAQQPSHHDSWVALGRAWVLEARRTGDEAHYNRALSAAVMARGVQAQSLPALNLQAVVHYNQLRFAEARKTAAAIVALDPRDPEGWGTLSDAELELGNLDAATAAAQRMMDLKPNLPSYSRASYLRWLRGDFEGAKKLIRMAYDARGFKDKEPGAWTLVQAARIFWHAGDADGADFGLGMALKDVPGYPPAMALRGQIRLAQGKADEAVELLDRAFEARPTTAVAWALVQALEAAEQSDEAARVTKRVHELGRTADPRTLSLFIASRGGDTAEALRLAESAAKQRGGPYTHDARAWALYKAGRLNDALVESRRALALPVPDPSLTCRAGVIRWRAGQVQAAKPLLAAALKGKSSVESSCAREARQLMKAGPIAPGGAAVAPPRPRAPVAAAPGQAETP